MNVIKLIGLTILNLARQALLLPQAAAVAFQRWKRLSEKSRFEVERLDRIRNPSKDVGR